MKNGTTYLTPGLKVVCLFTRCVLGDSLPQGVSGANRLPVTVDGWAPPHEQDSLLSLWQMANIISRQHLILANTLQSSVGLKNYNN